MQTNHTDYPSDDEIDLRQLFNTLWSKRSFILSITGVVALLAALYAFNKTPIYQASALVEIGNYQTQNADQHNHQVNLDSSKTLVKKLNILFIDLLKNGEDRDAVISAVSATKGADNFIEIKAEATSNSLATAEVLKVVDYVQTQHQEILSEIKNRHELEIANLNNKIDATKNKKIKLLADKIVIQEQNLQSYKSQLKQIDQNVKAIEASNPTLAALKLIEKRDLLTFITGLSLQLMDMRSKKDELETTAINQLLEKKQRIESMLLPHNYKNSEIVGQVITSEHPIKPKKRPIVAIALIAGFILSVFWVLVRQAFREDK